MSYDGIYLYYAYDAFDANPTDLKPAITFEFDRVRSLEKIYITKRRGRNFELVDCVIEVSLDGNRFSIFYEFKTEPSTTTFEVVSKDGPVKMKFVRVRKEKRYIALSEVAFIAW